MTKWAQVCLRLSLSQVFPELTQCSKQHLHGGSGRHISRKEIALSPCMVFFQEEEKDVGGMLPVPEELQSDY